MDFAPRHDQLGGADDVGKFIRAFLVMNADPSSARGGASGFTLAEVLIAAGLFVFVVTAIVTLSLGYEGAGRRTALQMLADHRATIAINRMVYGMGTVRGLRTARSSTVNLQSGSGGWQLSFVDTIGQTNRIEFDGARQRLLMHPGSLLIGTNITAATVVVSSTGAALRVRARVAEGRFISESDLESSVRWRN